MGELVGYAVHMRRRGLAHDTIERRESALRSFARWLDPRDLLDVTAEDIEVFLDSRRVNGRRIVNRTRYHWLSHLHKFYEWAEREGLIERDPTLDIERPKMKRLLPRPISEDDLALAIGKADRQMAAWFALGGYAGLRAGEVARLDVDDVLTHDGALRILAGKGISDRIVPMHDMVRELLEDWGLPKRGRVFTREQGGAWPPKYVSRYAGAFLRELGINATFHQCRHRFGTKTYEICQDIRVVAELMGHRSTDTAAGYVAYSQAGARAAVLALPS